MAVFHGTQHAAHPGYEPDLNFCVSFADKMKPAFRLRPLICLPLVFAFLHPVISEARDPQVIVDLHSRRAEIRAALLRHTPIGSSMADVVRFVSKQLQHFGATAVTVVDKPASGPAAEQSKQRGVKSIRVYLGQYYDHPEIVFLSAPLVMQREVSAQWAFDEHDRLIGVFVEKDTGVY